MSKKRKLSKKNKPSLSDKKQSGNQHNNVCNHTDTDELFYQLLSVIMTVCLCTVSEIPVEDHLPIKSVFRGQINKG